MFCCPAWYCISHWILPWALPSPYYCTSARLASTGLTLPTFFIFFQKSHYEFWWLCVVWVYQTQSTAQYFLLWFCNFNCLSHWDCCVLEQMESSLCISNTCCLNVQFAKHVSWSSSCHLSDSVFSFFFWRVGLVHFLNAYRCNLSICRHSQNAEWVQIAVMKLFHYGDEQCWINRNNKAECFIEPSVEVLWQRVLLCLQH